MRRSPRTRTAPRALTFKRAALAAVLLGMAMLSGCVVWRLQQSAALARASEPLQQPLEQPALRLLIVGDSTAVGTGASSPAHSLAGLMASAHPHLLIDNRARDGARFGDVLTQLQVPAAGGATFDLVLVLAGGNDVISPGFMSALPADIDRVIQRALQLGRTVVLMPSGNVGNAPFFFAPLSWWMTQRSRTLHRAVAAAAARPNVVYVKLFKERKHDPFVHDPSLNASDGLHPSDRGYAVWWQELQLQAGMSSRLQAAR